MNLLSELEKSFALYLSEIKELHPVSVKNYLSDLRYFFHWLEKKGIDLTKEFKAEIITSKLLNDYREYFLEEKIAKSTAKRRLATIRAFCQFCLNQNLLRKNPCLELEKPASIIPLEKQTDDLLTKFGTWLRNHKMSKNTIKNYLADIKSYLRWALNN